MEATDPECLELIEEVLAEGRHFLNPINYDWKIVPVLTVP